MNNPFRKNSRVKITKQFKSSNALVFGGVFAVIGIIALVSSFAATSSDTKVVEAESSALSGTIARLSDTGASVGEYLKFGSEPVTNGRGPTGQWPDGFPEYITIADIVTDGSTGGLVIAISTLASSGGVIEHPGNISGLGNAGANRTGNAPIVIRPPIGQRANYAMADKLIIRGDGLLFAGWNQTSEVQVWGATNSGIAWIEADGGAFRADAESETITVLWYETIYRYYELDGNDRSSFYATRAGANLTLDAVGLWIAGRLNPPEDQYAKADTIQPVALGGGRVEIFLRNSVLWASSNGSIQGGPGNPFHIRDSFVTSPGAAKSLFPGTVPPTGIIGYMAVTGDGDVTDSYLLGPSHPQFPVYASGSTLYQASSGIVDQGGNTYISSLDGISVPVALSHAELDAIWSP